MKATILSAWSRFEGNGRAIAPRDHASSPTGTWRHLLVLALPVSLVLGVASVSGAALDARLADWINGWGAWQAMIGPVIRSMRNLPLFLRESLAPLQYLGWPEWFLWPNGLLIVALALQDTALPWRQRGALIAASIQLRLVFATIAASSFLTWGMSQCWAWLPQKLQTLWDMPSAGAATAFAAAAAIGSVWPRGRTLLCGYVLLAMLGQWAGAGERLGQIVAGAALGLLASLLVRGWYVRESWDHHLGGHSGAKAWSLWRHPPAAHMSAPRQSEATLVTMAHTGFKTASLSLVSIGLVFLLPPHFIGDEFSQQQLRGNLSSMVAALAEHAEPVKSVRDLAPVDESENLGQWILRSREYCERFKGERVAMVPTLHPICVQDASFYWYDAENVLRLVREHPGYDLKPPYTMDADLIKARPALIDAVYLSRSLDKGALFPEIVARDYVQVKRRSGETWAYVRRDWLLDHMR